MDTVLMIMGPTAVGKTDLSIEIALRLNAEIISVDSRQVYKMLDIGTAKPDIYLRAKVPHHLVDIIHPSENYTVGRFQKDANVLIKQILSRKKLPMLVGGTGLYFRSILEGYQIPEIPVDIQVREQLKKDGIKYGTPYLNKKLEEVDPAAARRIHPNDKQRIIRALEIYHLTGKPFTEWRIKTDEPEYHTINIGLNRDRADLYRRINIRVEEMFAAGFVEEVRGLYEQGLHQSIGFQKTIGYPEVLSFLTGRLTMDEAMQLISQKTRNYAKRQLTWFRKEKNIRWFDLSFLPPGKNFTEIFQFIAGELKKNENINADR